MGKTNPIAFPPEFAPSLLSEATASSRSGSARAVTYTLAPLLTSPFPMSVTICLMARSSAHLCDHQTQSRTSTGYECSPTCDSKQFADLHLQRELRSPRRLDCRANIAIFEILVFEQCGIGAEASSFFIPRSCPYARKCPQSLALMRLNGAIAEVDA